LLFSSFSVVLCVFLFVNYVNTWMIWSWDFVLGGCTVGEIGGKRGMRLLHNCDRCNC
jgi:hypothetical protein